jgi:hypothetical protein
MHHAAAEPDPITFDIRTPSVHGLDFRPFAINQDLRNFAIWTSREFNENIIRLQNISKRIDMHKFLAFRQEWTPDPIRQCSERVALPLPDPPRKWPHIVLVTDLVVKPVKMEDVTLDIMGLLRYTRDCQNQTLVSLCCSPRTLSNDTPHVRRYSSSVATASRCCRISSQSTRN